MAFQFVNLQTAGGLGSFLPMIVVLFILYFFFIRPQAKKQKEQQKFLSELQKGQKIVTASGIIGTINKIEEKEVTIQTAEKTFIKVAANAISNDMTNAHYGKEGK